MDLIDKKKAIAFLKFNQMSYDDFSNLSKEDITPDLLEYIASDEFNTKHTAIKPKTTQENYVALVDSFIGLCASSQCNNSALTDIMQSGTITINENKYILPNINPFEYINLQKLQSMDLQPNNWSMLTADRLAKLITIANFIDGNTLNNASDELGIINGINMCIFYYINNTEIAYLLYACGLVSMLLWSDFYYFPLVKTWLHEKEVEQLNYTIPLKSLQKWSFLNIVIKSIAKPTNLYDLGVDYKLNAYDLFTMSYYTPDTLSANCLMSSLLEATYLQDFRKLRSSKIFIAFQGLLQAQEVVYKSTLSLGDAGSMATHWGSSFQNPDGSRSDMRIADRSHGYGCVKDRLPYKGNELYIAKSMLYTIIWSYKSTLRQNYSLFRRLDLVEEYKFLFSRCCYLFYKLRIILEIIYAPKIEKIPRSIILKEYNDDLIRERLESNWNVKVPE